MRRDYSGRRRRSRAALLGAVILLLAVFLVSCMASSGVLFVGGGFLFTTPDLSREEQVRELSIDGVLSESLCESVRGISFGNGELLQFRGEREANERCREALLFGMLENGYSAYVGNGKRIREAEEAYPHTRFLILIPAKDLEARAARYFGGALSHGSAGAFTYLERVEMYTISMIPVFSSVTVTPLSLCETANTYRLVFRLVLDERETEAYTAVFQKREDGTYVWYSLQK